MTHAYDAASYAREYALAMNERLLTYWRAVRANDF